MTEKEKLDEQGLGDVNGGFIVNKNSMFGIYKVVDGSGRVADSSYYMSYAKKRAAQYGLSDTVITQNEFSQLCTNGYFIRDGVKYTEKDGVVITE